MASRRDQLNAYTFAKRRMLAAFLQSSPDGSEEGAPRPLRAILPGVIIGVVVMAVFGAWGMFKPTAPKGWDQPNAKVIIASKSTTRYVILKTDGEVQLHPVLNMASAKLLLEAGGGDVVTVAESVLDNGKIPHGVTIGIPYAPDRLPSADEAGKAKRWAVCERPSAGGGDSVQKAALVLSGDEMKRPTARGAWATASCCTSPTRTATSSSWTRRAGRTRSTRATNCCCGPSSAPTGSRSGSPRSGWRPCTRRRGHVPADRGSPR